MISKLLLPSHNQIEKVITQDVEKLYTFQVVVAKLLEISRDEDASVDDLARVAETDPGISTRVLRIVNSSAFSLRRRITSIPEAISYLGFWEMHRMCLGISVFDTIINDGKNMFFDRVHFWRHSLSVAILSKILAEVTGYPKPEEAYLAGLLHDMGKIFFDLYGRINYGDFLQNISKSSGQLIEDERKLLGMGHDDLGSYFCSQWNLPDNLNLAMNLHHKSFKKLNLPDDSALLVAIVALSDFISWTQGVGSVNVVRHPILRPEIEKTIDVNKLDILKIIQTLDCEIKKTMEFYNFNFPSSEQLRENMLRANIRLGKMNTTYNVPEEEETLRIHTLTKLKESMVVPHRSLNQKEIIDSTLEAIHQDYHFDRLYILKVMKKNRALRVKNVFDTTDTGVDLKTIEFNISKDSGEWVKCLRDRVPAVITGRTSAENEVLGLFQVPEMFIVPFCNNNKVMGVIGMDNIVSKDSFPHERLTHVAIIANELGMALENARVFEKIKRMAQKDPLTGLLNRGMVDKRLEKSFCQAVAGENHLALMMVDIDYFKKFNDLYGHQSGDAVLKLIADLLKKLSRPTDDVGRYGGEEFIIILNNTSFSDSVNFGNRIRWEVEKLGQLLLKRFPGLPLTISIGLAGYTPRIQTLNELLSIADKALYRAKNSGRNMVIGE